MIIYKSPVFVQGGTLLFTYQALYLLFAEVQHLLAAAHFIVGGIVYLLQLVDDIIKKPSDFIKVSGLADMLFTSQCLY